MKNFPSTETAWFWTMGQIQNRREGRGPIDSRVDEIIKALDRLYRQRRIELAHARILRIWGERGRNPDNPGDTRLWREAIDRLGHVLKTKGMLAQ